MVRGGDKSLVVSVLFLFIPLTMSSVLQQILTALPNPEVVKIRDSKYVEKLLERIVESGEDHLQVITDFDHTLTRFHKNGEFCHTSHGILDNSQLMSPEFRKDMADSLAKYYPIEIDHELTVDEKVPFMIEWYDTSHARLIKEGFQKSWLTQMVEPARAFLRDDVEKYVKLLLMSHVPLIVLSAGIGDLVKEVLIHNGLDVDKLKIVSNFMEFDENGKLTGFKAPMIHTYNKNEDVLELCGNFHIDKTRGNLILLGDNLGDVNMVRNEQHNAVLKIGFLNNKIEERLDEFMNTFDVVLVDDQTFKFALTLLELILKKKESQ